MYHREFHGEKFFQLGFGLMRLPVFGGVISPRLRLFPRYDGGRFERDKKVMILGRGLGSHTLPIRIFNPGELVVIHLNKR